MLETLINNISIFFSLTKKQDFIELKLNQIDDDFVYNNNQINEFSPENMMSYWPSHNTLLDSHKISYMESKPIVMNFWVKPAKIGVYKNGDKRLVIHETSYSSIISNIYQSRSNTEYIVITDDSIYIVDASIQAVKIHNGNDDSV